ncbi:27705_t:CDS:2, partial [Dentiscutata erythropus]
LSSKALHKLEYHKQSQQKYKDQKKQKLQLIERQLKEADLNTQLVRPTGHPSLEEQQPGLLEAIVQIVFPDRQANERRPYLRLIPKWYSTEEGKRHVKTVPVKLLRSQNTARRSHEDTHFCAALIRNIKEMVLLLGSKNALVISQNNKAQIPLGLAAANKQGKYGQAEAVTYSGLTFIRIHSGKHDSSTAYSHGKDFDDLINEEKLHNYTTTNKQPKPVVVLISDGGPNENSRYRKTIQMMIEHFDKYNLDTIIVLKTNDEELEKHNFKAAADILTSIWEDTIINNYPVLVKYIDSPNKHYSPSEKSATWIEKHVMTCRYVTQVVKCDDPSLFINFKNYTRKCSRKESNLSVEAALDTQEFLVVYVHNYRHGEFLVSNESSETMWVEEEAVPEDVLEAYNQQVQVQEELVADKVLIVNWDTWKECE